MLTTTVTSSTGYFVKRVPLPKPERKRDRRGFYVRP